MFVTRVKSNFSPTNLYSHCADFWVCSYNVWRNMESKATEVETKGCSWKLLWKRVCQGFLRKWSLVSLRLLPFPHGNSTSHAAAWGGAASWSLQDAAESLQPRQIQLQPFLLLILHLPNLSSVTQPREQGREVFWGVCVTERWENNHLHQGMDCKSHGLRRTQFLTWWKFCYVACKVIAALLLSCLITCPSPPFAVFYA